MVVLCNTYKVHRSFRVFTSIASAKQPLILRSVRRQFCAMITFTPLSGAARSSSTTPLAYLLQIDDVRILLDCGSPDWVPEPAHEMKIEGSEEPVYHWETYCKALRE